MHVVISDFLNFYCLKSGNLFSHTAAHFWATSKQFVQDISQRVAESNIQTPQSTLIWHDDLTGL